MELYGIRNCGFFLRKTNFILLLVILIYTSPIFIKIGPKLPKFAIGGFLGWLVGWLGWSENWPSPTIGSFYAYPSKRDFHTKFHQNWKLADCMWLVGGYGGWGCLIFTIGSIPSHIIKIRRHTNFNPKSQSFQKLSNREIFAEHADIQHPTPTLSELQSAMKFIPSWTKIELNGFELFN